MAPVIRVSALRKTYGAGDTAVHALRGVDLTVHPGEQPLAQHQVADPEQRRVADRDGQRVTGLGLGLRRRARRERGPGVVLLIRLTLLGFRCFRRGGEGSPGRSIVVPSPRSGSIFGNHRREGSRARAAPWYTDE